VSNESSSATAIVLDRRLERDLLLPAPALILSLTAEERTRSRYHFLTDDDTAVFLQLPRGTTLQNGDLLAATTGEMFVRVIAKPELVLTITSDDSLNLLRAAYHLGNRHVSLEIAPTYLRLSPDPVLEGMLVHLGLQLITEVAPFCPQGGAYSHHH
jgi:urease accessory protein